MADATYNVAALVAHLESGDIDGALRAIGIDPTACPASVIPDEASSDELAEA